MLTNKGTTKLIVIGAFLTIIVSLVCLTILEIRGIRAPEYMASAFTSLIVLVGTMWQHNKVPSTQDESAKGEEDGEV